MKNKLIYILNHYSAKSSSHFFHVINLLEKISEHDVEIALVIEKCDDLPIIDNQAIKIYPINRPGKGRIIEMHKVLKQLSKQGFQNIFVRISWVAAFVSIITGWITGQKTYYWLSGQGTYEHYDTLQGLSKFKYWKESILKIWFIKRFVYRFVTGPESMGEYAVKVMNVPQQKIEILYNDISLDRFKPIDKSVRDQKEELGLNPDKKLIFFAHRFSPVRKSTLYFPTIFKKMFDDIRSKDYQVVIAGEGQEKQEVLMLLEKEPYFNQIMFVGNIPNANIQKYYQVTDVFINPTYAEGFPRVLIEAMACGAPVVTTDAGGIKDILGEEQSHFMVDKNNPELFGELLARVSFDKDLKLKLSQENQKIVKRFSTKNVSEMYVEKIFDN